MEISSRFLPVYFGSILHCPYRAIRTVLRVLRKMEGLEELQPQPHLAAAPSALQRGDLYLDSEYARSFLCIKLLPSVSLPKKRYVRLNGSQLNSDKVPGYINQPLTSLFTRTANVCLFVCLLVRNDDEQTVDNSGNGQISTLQTTVRGVRVVVTHR